jgi:phosphoribosylformimino-5-aminoimidazole carboxamide ribotide isomerase/phosphoribosylanthranilate isomerase
MFAAILWRHVVGLKAVAISLTRYIRLDRDGCARYVVTDVAKDGTLQGPNLELLNEVCAATKAPVIASGGISSLDDIRALVNLHASGIEGAIVGKALYSGAFTIQQALEVVQA